MTEEQKQARDENAKKAVIVNLQSTANNLRQLGDALGEHKTELNLLFDILEQTANRLHEGEPLNVFTGEISSITQNDEKLHDEIATLKAERNELRDRNLQLLDENLNLTSGKQLTETLQGINERLQGIELSLLKLSPSN